MIILKAGTLFVQDGHSHSDTQFIYPHPLPWHRQLLTINNSAIKTDSDLIPMQTGLTYFLLCLYFPQLYKKVFPLFQEQNYKRRFERNRPHFITILQKQRGHQFGDTYLEKIGLETTNPSILLHFTKRAAM